MTEEKLRKEITELWKTVKRLEETYKEERRKFTVDGHLLGSLGEVYAKAKYNLKLLSNSTERHDAIDDDGKYYQIKITQRESICLKTIPDNLIVIKIKDDGEPEIIYKNLGKPVWDYIEEKKKKHYSITLMQLKEIEIKLLQESHQ
ncbi:hypothetical protein LIS90_13155 [Flavobacterium psychrophilum]|uniref:DUF6998 domain-containing protein n=1 Tax=Flavobacterium psychrophilum TaxID=96345 RepID=UPI001D0959B0|nr:hypothetical protein [Flavobacterium psychrophilum]MCB6232193.1 hypothetical protein [Flavobacterium psychrophilum]